MDNEYKIKAKFGDTLKLVKFLDHSQFDMPMLRGKIHDLFNIPDDADFTLA
ncbi:hypothetical protein CIPAW_11G020400 [Carya illinoinensis]|uniref:Uncharacterized protein n=1 Tax=Carya illinoinensis TaxID=32201 RepID=A0A8T1NXC9_CARIL|nr:hypothetical protein CIPAW_11G020400 [Carya illinoinensis]